MEIFFVSHATTRADVEASPRIAGKQLSHSGVMQAQLLGKELGRRSFDAFYSSDEREARLTLSELQPYLGSSKPLDTSLRLLTTFQRELRGRESKPSRAFSDQLIASREEQLESFLARIESFLEKLHASKAERVLVLTHREVIQAAISLMIGLPIEEAFLLDVPPASISVFDFEDGSASSRCIGERQHLAIASQAPFEFLGTVD